jgi:hypothetical protein
MQIGRSLLEPATSTHQSLHRLNMDTIWICPQNRVVFMSIVNMLLVNKRVDEIPRSIRLSGIPHSSSRDLSAISTESGFRYSKRSEYHQPALLSFPEPLITVVRKASLAWMLLSQITMLLPLPRRLRHGTSKFRFRRTDAFTALIQRNLATNVFLSIPTNGCDKMMCEKCTR